MQHIKKRKLKKSYEEFPGGLAVKDSALSLLWFEFNSIFGTFACCGHSQKKKKERNHIIISIYIEKKHLTKFIIHSR